MPGAIRVGVDVAGTGVVLGPGAASGGAPVFVEGAIISLVGDAVAPHGKPPHTTAILPVGSSTVFGPGGRPVTYQGATATCGHPLAPGSTTVIVGR